MMTVSTIILYLENNQVDNSQPNQPLESQPQQTVYPQQQPAQVYAPVPMTTPPQKKSLLWLWITLGSIVVLAIATAVTFVVGIAGANTVAKEYTSNVKTYLDDVADAVAGTASSPRDIQNDVKKIDRPKLEDSLFAGMSNDYKEAEKTQKEVATVVEAATTELGKYIDFADTAQKAKTAHTALEAAAVRFSSAAYAKDATALFASIRSMNTTCKDLTGSLEGTNIPESTKKVMTDYDDIATNLCDAVADATSAIDNQNQSGLQQALRDFSEPASKYDEAARLFFAEADAIAKNVKKLADPVRKLADTL